MVEGIKFRTVFTIIYSKSLDNGRLLQGFDFDSICIYRYRGANGLEVKWDRT